MTDNELKNIRNRAMWKGLNKGERWVKGFLSNIICGSDDETLAIITEVDTGRKFEVTASTLCQCTDMQTYFSEEYIFENDDYKVNYHGEDEEKINKFGDNIYIGKIKKYSADWFLYVMNLLLNYLN